MLVQTLKSGMSKQIRILSYTCSHHVLCIIALITNDEFPSRDIMCVCVCLRVCVRACVCMYIYIYYMLCVICYVLRVTHYMARVTWLALLLTGIYFDYMSHVTYCMLHVTCSV